MIGGNNNVYCVQLQLDMNYYKNDIGLFDLYVYGQVVKFISVNLENLKVDCFYIELLINLFLFNGWGSLNIEVKLLVIYY